MPATLIDAIDRHAAVRGGKIATRHLGDGGATELTYAQFAARSEHYAGHFQALGLAGGDPVLIFMPTSPETLPAFLGAMMIGAIPSLMPCPSAKQHPAIYWPSHAELLARTAPRLLVSTRDNAAQIIANGLGTAHTVVAIEDLGDAPLAVRRETAAPDDIALLQHSSGTTGLKKGVALSHDAILRQVRSYAARLEASEADTIVSWLPIYHDMGLIACSVMPLVLGQTVTTLDPFRWVGRPATLFDAIERYRGQFTWLPNFAFEHLVRAVPRDYAADLSSMRCFIDCSEPCKPETLDRFADRFADNGIRRDMLGASYAMAETVFAVSQTAAGAAPQSVSLDADTIQREARAVDATTDGNAIWVLGNGTPIAGITVEVRADGRALPEDHVGEIAVRGDFLFDGYFRDPDLTAKRIVDGWYHTRDRGFLRDGELYILGRTDDLMIVSGRNLHANEVERLLDTIPGVKPGRAVAFGAYSKAIASEELVIIAERGESAPADEQAIENRVRELVFDHAGIDVKHVMLVGPGWLVKTTSGKISREANQRRYAEMLAATDAAEVAPSRSVDTFSDVAHIIGRVFRVPVARITRETVSTDIAGWDSLAHSTLILEIEQDLGIRFADDEIFGFENVGALVDRASALRDENGGTGSDRIVAETGNFSILVMGEPSDAPDLVIFAGAALLFGGKNMMDFASTLRGTAGEKSRRFFVTDRSKRWFTDSLDEIAAALNAASPGPKVLIGNSMGGYGALKFAPLLDNVISVLAFAPQPAPPLKIAREFGLDGKRWYVRPARRVPTCIIYGEIEDERGKDWIGRKFANPAYQTMLTLANCGHNVVPYLQFKKLLGEALLTALDPATMAANLTRIIGSVAPSLADLRLRVESLRPTKKRHAMRELEERYPEIARQIIEAEATKAASADTTDGGRDRD